MWTVLDNKCSSIKNSQCGLFLTNKFSSTKMHKNFILNIHHDNHNDYIICLFMICERLYYFNYLF